MARIQLALNVTDVEAAVDFYSRLLDVRPHKQRPGYANFALEEPPLKLVLIEGEGEGASLNHLGIEVDATDEVAAATARLAGEGLEVDVREAEVCCHARQDKVWVADPDGARWEIYTVTDDDPVVRAGTEPACC